MHNNGSMLVQQKEQLAVRTSCVCCAGGEKTLLALTSLPACMWMIGERLAYYRVAVAAVARKLCRIVFAVMRDRNSYDPGRTGGGPFEVLSIRFSKCGKMDAGRSGKPICKP